MSPQQPGRARPQPALTFAAITALLLVASALGACTRAEVFSAVSTAVVDVQATADGQSQTRAADSAVATTQSLAASAATASAESNVPLPTLVQDIATVPVELLEMGTAAAVPPATAFAALAAEATATVPPSPTPEPTSTPVAPTPVAPTPVATPVEPTPTTEPSPTPWPPQISLNGAEMVLVPSGPFSMGGRTADILAECEKFRDGCQAEWFLSSDPAHIVTVAPFYIDLTEVTNLAFVTFLNELGANGGACQGQTCFDPEASQIAAGSSGFEISGDLATVPVAGVSWPGAAAFCEWRGSRLPTEAEWEKAARWDATSESGRVYPWGDAFDGQQVNFCDVSCEAEQANADFDDGFTEAAPVGSFPDGRSPSGALDMAGNLWEWVSDWYDDGYYAQTEGAVNPQGPATGEARVVRGGSWFDTGNFTSGLIRFPSPPDNADRTIGFRCALTPAE